MGSCPTNHPADLAHHLAGGKPVGQCVESRKDNSAYQLAGLGPPDKFQEKYQDKFQEKYQDKFNDKYQEKYRVEANLGQEKFRSDDNGGGGEKGMFGLEDKNSKQKRHR